mmetsp:Transcript_65186/g.201797  ORF Transcript_65186/g.201797 Transcript_65186/m.201797 type:complete len:257 (-) Transcript_65186:123-893(-)
MAAEGLPAPMRHHGKQVVDGVRPERARRLLQGVAVPALLALGTLMPPGRARPETWSVAALPRPARAGGQIQGPGGCSGGRRGAAAPRRAARLEGEESDLSEEDFLRLIRGSYEDLVQAVSRPGMVEQLRKVAGKAGISAQMRFELALTEAKSKGGGSEGLFAVDTEAERSRAEATLRQMVEEVRGISEAIYLRPIGDRVAKALEQATAAGVDKSVINELRKEAVSLFKEHQRRFSWTPKTVTGREAGETEYDVYLR